MLARSLYQDLGSSGVSPPPTIEFDDRFDKFRLIDGFEGYWFVWKIEPDEGGVAVVEPAPARLVPG